MKTRTTKQTRKKRYNESQVRKLLQAAITEVGSQRAFAELHSISQSYVSEALAGDKPIGEKVLDALGLNRLVLFESKE